MPHPHVHTDFVIPPLGCGRSVTDFWGWGVHRAQLGCSDDVSDDMYERGVPGGALNLNSTAYPDHGHYWNLPLQRKNSHGRTGNRTRHLMASSQKIWPTNHEAGQINKFKNLCITLAIKQFYSKIFTTQTVTTPFVMERRIKIRSLWRRNSNCIYHLL
jgi:hypothetical protein